MMFLLAGAALIVGLLVLAAKYGDVLDEIESMDGAATRRPAPVMLPELRATVTELGLEWQSDQPSSAWYGIAHGRSGEIAVRVDVAPGKNVVRLQTRADFLPAVAIRPDRTGEAAGTGRTLSLPWPDLRARVDGPPHTLAALLTHNVRRSLQAALSSGMRVADGSVVRELFLPRVGPCRPLLTEAYEQVIGVTKALRLDRDEVRARLLANATGDPSDEVRLHNLELLLADRGAGPPDAEVVAACRAALDADKPELRFVAACELGDEGAEVLAGMVADRDAPTGLRRQALERVLASHPDLGKQALLGLVADRHAATGLRKEALFRLQASFSELVDGAVSELLGATDDPLFASAVAVAGRLRSPALIERMVAVAAEPSTKHAAFVSLTEALGADGAALEPALLARLPHTSGGHAVPLVEVLARIGTRRAVEPLLRASRNTPNHAFQQAVQAAVAAIQERLGEVDGGRLSLVADRSDGRLSLGDDAGAQDGSLTMAQSEGS